MLYEPYVSRSSEESLARPGLVTGLQRVCPL